jgi:Na+/H+-dicarboxylate symporter
MWAWSNFIGSHVWDSVYDILLNDAIEAFVFMTLSCRVAIHFYRLIFVLAICFLLVLVELLACCRAVICYFLFRRIWKPAGFLVLVHTANSSVHPFRMQQLDNG